MGYLIVAISMFLLGVVCTPLIIFIRARRDDAWDDSNIMNIYRVVAHLATHPSDFGLMMYEDGKAPFHYINKDEITEVVDARPED